MSIRDRGLQPYTGVRHPPGRAVLVIASAAIRAIPRRKAARRLFVLSLLILVGWTFTMMPAAAAVRAGAGGEGGLAQIARGAGVGLDPGGVLCAFLTRWYGAVLPSLLMALALGSGVVADDRSALPLYFARPVTPGSYLVGKIAGAASSVAIVSLVPALILWLVYVVGSGFAEPLVAVLLLGRTLLLGSAVALGFAVPVVAVSAVVRAKRSAQTAAAALVLLPWILGAMFHAAMHSPWPLLGSLPAEIAAAGALVFGAPASGPAPGADQDLPGWAGALALVVVIAASIEITRRRAVAMAEGAA